MITDTTHNLVVSQWTRLGILFNAPAADRTPDLERLLIDTARICESNPRLFVLVVTWLTRHGLYVARHRLKALATRELDEKHRAVLGLILDTAIDAGATGELKIVLRACAPAKSAKPLFVTDRDDERVVKLVRETATPTSLRWNLWVQPFDLKYDAIRPVTRIIDDNSGLWERALRGGDLRCSILEVLKHDAPYHRAVSESELARLCSASRKAVRDALDRLEQVEGIPLRETSAQGKHSVPVKLSRKAA